MIDLAGFDTGNGLNPLFPNAESFLSNEDIEEDWLSF